MLGGLYGDLPPPSSTVDDPTTAAATSTTANVWSSSVKMAPPTLRKPFPPPQARIQPKPKPQVQPAFKPVSSSPIVEENSNSSSNPNAKTTSFQLVGLTSTVSEEYDPARPNDYEEYCRERKRKQVEAEVMKREKEREERESREKERDLNISGEEAWRRRAAMSGGDRVAAPRGSPPRSGSPVAGNGDFSIGKSESGGLGVGAEGKMTAAQRMMAKMGWKAGQGLGKQEQGITTPLMVKKTDKRAGNIVNESAEKKVKSVQFNMAPTRVVLLRNMVCLKRFSTAFIAK